MSKPEVRARVRELVAIVTQDMFPFANRRNGLRLREVAGATEDGQREFIQRALNEGFDAYETFAREMDDIAVDDATVVKPLP